MDGDGVCVCMWVFSTRSNFLFHLGTEVMRCELLCEEGGGVMTRRSEAIYEWPFIDILAGQRAPVSTVAPGVEYFTPSQPLKA